MGIWEILGIDPTTDKKQIKRAYAAQSRKVHPEEKPEEFRMLYEAYQEALEYAGASGTGRSGSVREPEYVEERELAGEDSGQMPSAGVPSAKQEQTEGAELRSYFQEKTQEQEEKIAFFREKWKMIMYEHGKPEVKEWWEDYLKSEEFRDIQWHPELLKLLAEEMSKHLKYEYEIRLFFWDAYGFQEKDSTSKGDLQKLRRALYTAYERRRGQQERERLEVERQLENKKNQRFLMYIYLFVFGIWLLYLAITKANEMLGRWGGIKGHSEEFGLEEGDADKFNSVEPESEEAYTEEFIEESDIVKAYLEERYPGTDFSEPKLVEEDIVESVYEMYSLSHPDITFEAVIDYDIMDASILGVTEEYGRLLMEHYAEEYGLKCWWMMRSSSEWPDLAEDNNGVSVIFYPDMDTLDEFCDTVIRMFEEQEELRNLSAVGICSDDVQYPTVMVGGGVEGCYPGKGQFYRPWELDTVQMKEMIQEGYLEYLIHFEPWNLTSEQYRDWVPGYEERYKSVWENFDLGVSVLLQEKDICEIYIPIYAYDEFGRATDVNAPSATRMMLVGDAYFYLLAKGAYLEVTGIGRGFDVEKDGEFYYLGFEPEVELEKVEEFIPKQGVEGTD